MCAGRLHELTVSDSVGWLLRGGILIEQLFIDYVMVLGDALQNAYYLEDKIMNDKRLNENGLFSKVIYKYRTFLVNEKLLVVFFIYGNVKYVKIININ